MFLFGRIGLAAALACLAAIGMAQANLAWSRIYQGPLGFDDAAADVVLDASGNAYVTGFSVSQFDQATGNATRDCLTLKYDRAGNLRWSRTFGFADGIDQEGTALAVGDDGLVTVAGSDGNKLLVLRYDDGGNLLWSSTYAGPGMLDFATGLCFDEQGNTLVVGASADSDGVFLDYLVCKFDAFGNLLWARRYDGPGQTLDFARAIRCDAAGNAYVTGYSEGIDTGFDIATLKISPAGDLVWVARYAFPGAGDDGANDLDLDSAGNVYVAGTSPRQGSDEILLVKYSPSGQEVWVKRYVGSAGGIDAGRFVAVHRPSGDVFLAGFSLHATQGYDFLTCRYLSNGTLAWARRFNGPVNGNDFPQRLRVDADGNCYVAGSAVISTGNLNLQIVKYNMAGSQVWDRHYDGGFGANDEATALAVGPDGAVFATGYTKQTNAGTSDVFTVCVLQPHLLGGTINLPGYAGPIATLSFTVEVRLPGSITPIQTTSAIVTETGRFVVATPFNNATYDVTVKAPRWLRKKRASIPFGQNGVTWLTFTLTLGDIDDDNEVSIGDYSLLSAAFGATPEEFNWNPHADLNGDNAVDIGDFAILSSNFGLLGDD